jgi:hypothetical protein
MRRSIQRRSGGSHGSGVSGIAGGSNAENRQPLLCINPYCPEVFSVAKLKTPIRIRIDLISDGVFQTIVINESRQKMKENFKWQHLCRTDTTVRFCFAPRNWAL